MNKSFQRINPLCCTRDVLRVMKLYFPAAETQSVNIGVVFCVINNDNQIKESEMHGKSNFDPRLLWSLRPLWNVVTTSMWLPLETCCEKTSDNHISDSTSPICCFFVILLKICRNNTTIARDCHFFLYWIALLILLFPNTMLPWNRVSYLMTCNLATCPDLT